MGYASRTGTKRNLAALRKAGWRLLVSARGVLRTEGFRYALDNGAWSAFQAGNRARAEALANKATAAEAEAAFETASRFDVEAFEKAVALLGADADWIVVPDVVCNTEETLRMAREWIPKLSQYYLLIAVQNGMTPDDVRHWLSPRIGIFLGGDSEWKEQTARMWGELAKERGCWFHVGRVNSARRIAICAEAGADSFDGTSASRYALSLPRLDRAVRQASFAWPSEAA